MADETNRLFLVEHDLRGLSSWQLASVYRALGQAVRRENQRGGRIRYVQRIYAPDEQRCLCLFEATGPDLVRSVNDIAQFPLARVMAVLARCQTMARRSVTGAAGLAVSLVLAVACAACTGWGGGAARTGIRGRCRSGRDHGRIVRFS